jgi:hypothetical protein
MVVVVVLLSWYDPASRVPALPDFWRQMPFSPQNYIAEKLPKKARLDHCRRTTNITIKTQHPDYWTAANASREQ